MVLVEALYTDIYVLAMQLASYLLLHYVLCIRVDLYVQGTCLLSAIIYLRIRPVVSPTFELTT